MGALSLAPLAELSLPRALHLSPGIRFRQWARRGRQPLGSHNPPRTPPNPSPEGSPAPRGTNLIFLPPLPSARRTPHSRPRQARDEEDCGGESALGRKVAPEGDPSPPAVRPLGCPPSPLPWLLRWERGAPSRTHHLSRYGYRDKTGSAALLEVRAGAPFISLLLVEPEERG